LTAKGEVPRIRRLPVEDRVNDATGIAWLMVAGGAFLLLSSWNDYRWMHFHKRRGFELDDTIDTDWGSRSMRRISYFLFGTVDALLSPWLNHRLLPLAW
jgi:hypothetical protein